jgi:hypothetical protein
MHFLSEILIILVCEESDTEMSYISHIIYNFKSLIVEIDPSKFESKYYVTVFTAEGVY